MEKIPLCSAKRQKPHKNEPNGNSKTKEQNYCTEKVYRKPNNRPIK